MPHSKQMVKPWASTYLSDCATPKDLWVMAVSSCDIGHN